MRKNIFFWFLFAAGACSNIWRSEKSEKTDSFVQQLKAVPIWTEKDQSDTKSNVLYRIPVGENGDIQLYSNKMKFLSSSSPTEAKYLYQNAKGAEGSEITLFIQSNSVMLKNAPFPATEFFRSYKEPIERVFITNLLAVPVWYPKAHDGQLTYIKMIIESNGTYYPEDYNPNDASRELYWTLLSAQSPSVGFYQQIYKPAPEGVSIPVFTNEIEKDRIVWLRSGTGGSIDGFWVRSSTKPADED